MNIWTVFGITIFVVFLAYLIAINHRFLLTLTLIAQATPYEQNGSGARVLVVGDSTGYGTGAATPSESVVGRLGSEFPDLAIENRSVNGDTIAEATERVRDLTTEYDLILLQLGGNDILQQRPIESVERDIKTLYDALEENTEHIVMMSAGNVGAATAFSGEQAERYTQHSLAFHAALEYFAADRPDFTYVNLYEPPETDPFVAEPEIYLARDGLHPSSAGYGVWYRTARAAITEQLEQTQ